MRHVPRSLVYALLPCLVAAVSVEAGSWSLTPPAPSHRVAFVTSTTYSGNLGGLAGADQACQDRALAAGLDNSSAFRAWLSDSTTDAYCHVQGFSGTRAGNCGLATLPTEVGPWVRVDGSAFAGRIDEMANSSGVILAPPNLDEYGATLASTEAYWANSDYSGALSASTPASCADWTSADGSSSAFAGSVSATTGGWAAVGAMHCDSGLRLLCLEAGGALPLPPHHVGGALAFVTSTAHDGSLGGLAGADAICQGLASTGGLPVPGSFVALLSDSGSAAADRLTIDGPWVRVDGVQIAASKAELFDGALDSAVNVDESGAYVANWNVWSGSSFTGTGTALYCGDWASTSGSGYAGRANRTASNWLSNGTLACSSSASRLYCFANVVAVIFVDDLESADDTAWSVTMP